MERRNTQLRRLGEPRDYGQMSNSGPYGHVRGSQHHIGEALFTPDGVPPLKCAKADRNHWDDRGSHAATIIDLPQITIDGNRQCKQHANNLTMTLLLLGPLTITQSRSPFREQ